MQQLMRAPHTGESQAPVAEAMPDGPLPLPVSLADNRSAGRRLTLLLIASSCLISLTSTCIWIALKFPGEPLSPKGVAISALGYLWPVVPGLALLWRWSRKLLFAMMLLWVTAIFGVLLWLFGLVLAFKFVAWEIALPMVLVFLIFFLGSATRAIAPWLLMPAVMLVASVLAGLEALTYTAKQESPLLKTLIALLEWLPGWIGVTIVFALVMLLSAIIAWWPMRMLGRALGHAYSRKWLSDLLVVFTGVWAFGLTDRALPLSTDAGARAFAMYLPLLWIPALMLLADRRQPGRAPTLLVLRVFQRDQQARSLFDHVVERWRLSGNTVMIAGTDLADRTLDADDILQFLDRRLAERFVVSPADVARRIDAFDMAADIDGRYRVNECYCHDTTWQYALQALMRHSDIVLMDLRGFQSNNAGCRYELATLAQAARKLRVVVLTDSRTDRAAAQEAIASGQQERFIWIEASHFRRSKHREVMVRLFA